MRALHPSSARSRRGSVLLTALVLGALAGIMLAACLQIIQSRHVSVMRSHAWNSAIPVLEAGIEEAFTHLKVDTFDLTANGWEKVSVDVYQKTRTFPDSSYFITTISNTPGAPVIVSQGFVPLALEGGYVSRRVQVTTTNRATFNNAVAAVNRITLSAGAVVDSFDSTDSNYSTNGFYDPNKRKSGGSLVTNSKLIDAIHVGAGRIYGEVKTGPGGTVTVDSNGGVGEYGWSSAHPGQIQPEMVGDDMNVAFADQALPSSWSPVPPTMGWYGGTNYTYVLNNGEYILNSVQIGRGRSILAKGDCVLYVNGDFTVWRSGLVYIAPGSSLKLFVSGNGNIFGGVIINATKNPANMAYIGLPGSTKLTIRGNGAFIGTINAPQADFTVSGSVALYGAAIVKSFNNRNGSVVHFDEGLGGGSNLAITSYREM